MADRSVAVRLTAVTAQYEAAMARAGVHTKGLGTQIDQLGTRGASSIKALTNGLVDLSGKGALAAGGIALGGAALVKFLSDGLAGYTDLVGKVDAYQDVTGAAADESSRMVAIAEAFGVSVETLAGSMFRLAKNVEENADGLARYGVEVARSADGSVDLNATLLNVADAYKEVGGGQAGALLAQEAFGRGGRALIDILERERVELEAVTRAAEEHGQIVSEKDIESVVRYEAAMNELSQSMAELGRAAAEDIVPFLTDVAHTITDVKERIEDLAGVVPGLGDAIRDALESSLPPLEMLRGSWLEGAADMNPLTHALYELTVGQDDAARSTEGYVTVGEGLAAMQREQAAATGDLADEIVTLDDALAALLGQAFSAEDALDKVNTTIIEMAGRVADARDEVGDAATSMDATTQAGLANRDMWRGLVGDVAAAAAAMKTQGAADVEVAAMIDLQRRRLFDLAAQLGFNQAEVGRYIDILLQVPGATAAASSGTIDVDTGPAESKVRGLIGLINGVLGAVARVNQALNVAQYGSAATDRIPAFQMPSSSPPAALGLPSFPAPARSGGGGGGAAGPDPVEEAERAREEWLRADDEFRRNQYEHNQISLADYQRYLRDRMAMEREGSAEHYRLLDEEQRVLDERAANEQAWNDAVARNEEEAAQRRADAIEAGRRIRERQAREEQRRSEEVARERERAADKLARLVNQERDIRDRIEKNTAAHHERLRAVEDKLAADQDAAISSRQEALLGWADVNDRVQVRWGNTASALARNIQDQISVFRRWTDALAGARARGVSEEVIALLGLDKSPEALGQLQAFTSATEAEIADLNAAVEARTRQAAEQVGREQADSYSEIGRTLKGLSERYAEEVEAQNEEFLARQRELTDDLKALGFDQGKGYGDLVAAGLRSTVPGVRAAAEELLDAMKPAVSAVFPRSDNPLTKPILGPKAPSGEANVKVDVFVGNKLIQDEVKVVLRDGAGQRTIVGSK